MNILIQSDIKDFYDVTYFPGEKYMIHMEGRDMEFCNKNKLYVLDISHWVRDNYMEGISLMKVGEKDHLQPAKKR